MNPLDENRRHLTRRSLFGRTAVGLGAAALASLLDGDLLAAPEASGPRTAADRVGGLSGLPHFAPKARRVIYLFQNGAPSHVDLFDYKPRLKQWHGKEIPPEIQGGKRLSTMTGGQKAKPVLGEITKFDRHGQSGAWVSDFLPHTASIAD